jgi:hypothetical protein
MAAARELVTAERAAGHHHQSSYRRLSFLLTILYFPGTSSASPREDLDRNRFRSRRRIARGYGCGGLGRPDQRPETVRARRTPGNYGT